MRAERRKYSRLYDYPPEPETRSCDHPGCAATGEHRAPKSRDRLNDYYWFCLDHVRQYNKAWNFYAGLSDDEVERMVRMDTVWQRQSWPMGTQRRYEEALRERVRREFTGEDDAQSHARREQPRHHRTEEESAMAVLDLDFPVDFATVKARYKTLVKQHHPDANGGSREAEEKLKTINHAYGVLKRSFAA
ncbi:DnaJ domain-containing protein [Inquilinus sp. CAU 1745]|uniref:J domain-containing protein n=1 Tax=Inquilinus sp. CAU 1745 TaxID=3140369 RepID=UPI00325A844D